MCLYAVVDPRLVNTVVSDSESDVGTGTDHPVRHLPTLVEETDLDATESCFLLLNEKNDREQRGSADGKSIDRLVVSFATCSSTFSTGHLSYI